MRSTIFKITALAVLMTASFCVIGYLFNAAASKFLVGSTEIRAEAEYGFIVLMVGLWSLTRLCQAITAAIGVKTSAPAAA